MDKRRNNGKRGEEEEELKSRTIDREERYDGYIKDEGRRRRAPRRSKIVEEEQ